MFCQKLDSILCSNFRLLSVVNHILNCIINIENTKARIHSVYEIKYGIMIQESSILSEFYRTSNRQQNKLAKTYNYCHKQQ